jgi:hypothetical protein
MNIGLDKVLFIAYRLKCSKYFWYIEPFSSSSTYLVGWKGVAYSSHYRVVRWDIVSNICSISSAKPGKRRATYHLIFDLASRLKWKEYRLLIQNQEWIEKLSRMSDENINVPQFWDNEEEAKSQLRIDGVDLFQRLRGSLVYQITWKFLTRSFQWMQRVS